MHKNIVVFALAVALAGCAGHHPGDKSIGARALDSRNPGVQVVDEKFIVVDQEPLYFGRGAKDVVITWQLPADSKYRFPKDGISIRNAGEEFVRCHPEQNGLRFACVNRNTKPGTYKYSIAVEGTPAVQPLDPTIVNY